MACCGGGLAGAQRRRRTTYLPAVPAGRGVPDGQSHAGRGGESADDEAGSDAGRYSCGLAIGRLVGADRALVVLAVLGAVLAAVLAAVLTLTLIVLVSTPRRRAVVVVVVVVVVVFGGFQRLPGLLRFSRGPALLLRRPAARLLRRGGPALVVCPGLRLPALLVGSLFCPLSHRRGVHGAGSCGRRET